MTTSYDKTSKSQTKSDIYQISSSGMHLIQHIFFGSDFIREFSLKDKHYILACSSKGIFCRLTCFLKKIFQSKYIFNLQMNATSICSRMENLQKLIKFIENSTITSQSSQIMKWWLFWNTIKFPFI